MFQFWLCEIFWGSVLALGGCGVVGEYALGWWEEAARLCDSAFCLEVAVAKTQLLPLHAFFALITGFYCMEYAYFSGRTVHGFKELRNHHIISHSTSLMYCWGLWAAFRSILICFFLFFHLSVLSKWPTFRFSDAHRSLSQTCLWAGWVLFV